MSNLSNWLALKKAKSNTIPSAPADARIPLSSGQQRLWLLQQLYPDNPFYQYAHRYDFKGQLDVSALLESFQLVAHEHAILRTRFVAKDDEVYQEMQESVLVPTEVIDVSHLQGEAQAQEVAHLTKVAARQLFDLTKDVLLRVTVLKISETAHTLILSMHHIIGDRWSLQVLNEALAKHYQALSNQTDTEITKNSIEYSDYAHWQNGQAAKKEDLAYWTAQLSGELPVLSLPTAAMRSAQPSFEGISITKPFSKELSTQIKAFCQTHSTTPYVVLLTAYQVLLQRYSGQNDILVGTPFSNRDKTVLEKMIGFFNETLVLRGDLSGNPSFLELIAQMKQTTSDAFAHKSTPFEQLVDVLKPARHGTANPIFQVMFLYNALQATPSFGEALQVSEEVVDLGVSKFDLTLFVTDTGDNLTATFEYSTDLFEKDSIARMQAHLEVLLTSIVANPNQGIGELAILPQAEKDLILRDWNQTEAIIPQDVAIHKLFEAQAQQNPHTICVAYENDSLTYEAVNQRANAIAQGLMQQGISANDMVGLHVERSVDMIVGIIAIHKAGGAYLPLDPEYPSERIQFMLENAEVKVVLTQASIEANLPKGSAKHLSYEAAMFQGEQSKTPLPKVKNTQLAYMIYTSGSTGQPKGVPITHANLVHSTAARYHFYTNQPEAFLLMSSYSFDSSVAGIFWALTQGGKLVIPKKRIEQDIEGLAQLISAQGITHSLMLPSLYQLLLEHAPKSKLQSLNTIMVAGEACASTVVQKHFATLPEAKLYNEYGPTEGTVWCTAHEIKESDANALIPIGRPIPNVQNYILDAQLNPVPIGVAGELCIAGAGLSSGYWKRDELTAKKFVTITKLEQSKRIYRTGDLAKYRTDGTIEFLGRIDQQVKIRGYRVELDEIKETILRVAKVQEALVVIHQSGEVQRLVSYFTAEQTIDIAQLSNTLKAQLPSYMVPDAFVQLDEFPRLPNGKVNQHELPEPGAAAIARSDAFESPSTEVEQQLAGIWSEVLSIEAIGRNDNFFDIGGNSILSIRIIAKARQLGLTMAANQLFEHQTIRELAAAIAVSKNQAPSLTLADLPLINQQTFPLSYMQQAFLMHHLQNEKDQGFLQLEFSLKGAIQTAAWEQAWEKTALRHPVLRTSIAWQNQAQAVQEVRPKADFKWNYLDWTSMDAAAQAIALDAFGKADEAKGLDLGLSPMGRMALIQTGDEQYLFFWTCHHILLDGWSGGIVLKDALKLYAAAAQNQASDLAAIPTYASFLHWQGEQDLEAAKLFWQQRFEQHTDSSLIGEPSGQAIYENLHFQISKEKTTALQAVAKAHRVTLNTLLQGAWAILLGQYFDTKEVTFGTTVSGRFADFPNMEDIAGLFMNVLPNKVQWEATASVGHWLQQLQKNNIAANAHDQNNLEQITQWINWTDSKPLFDTLFVYGNFMKDGIEIGDIAVDGFEGGFTSGYPLTIRVNPLEALAFDFRYEATMVGNANIELLQSQWLDILEAMMSNADASIAALQSQLAQVDYQKIEVPLTKNEAQPLSQYAQDYVAPRNAIELQLTKIWEALFGRNPIGVTDNFFEIGGKSLLAMQLFAKIESEMDCLLPPVTLMQHPTIEALAKRISADAAAEAWTSIVPLRASGSRTPLFCIHAGGAHVFFYSGLVKHLDEDQPVYAIQPKGLDGKQAFDGTIEEMASNYITDVLKVQPEGPYKLLGTCFSNAVCLEMANQLHAMGKEVEMFIVDSAPAHLIPLEKKKPVRRFLKILKDQDWSMLYRKVRRRILIFKSKVEVKKESAAQKQLQETINSLNSLYAAYTWKPFAGKVSLLRSTQFAYNQGKHFHLSQWKALAKGGLEVHVVEGKHLTIFEEPDVGFLGAKLEECLNQKVT